MIKSKIINTFVPLLLLPFFILACGESDNIEPKDEKHILILVTELSN
jgi:hypothetical protein